VACLKRRLRRSTALWALCSSRACVSLFINRVTYWNKKRGRDRNHNSGSNTDKVALEGAATGHLVLGTLHTQNAPKTVDRISDIFPANQQAQIRATLADTLKAVVAQGLCKRVDVPGRCAALEILIVPPSST
jgi:Type II/IV secretion system protein